MVRTIIPLSLVGYEMIIANLAFMKITIINIIML